MPNAAQETVKLICDKNVRGGEAARWGVRVVMSNSVNAEPFNTQTKAKPAPRSSSDGRVLAEVEKWMEMIREISREPAKN